MRNYMLSLDSSLHRIRHEKGAHTSAHGLSVLLYQSVFVTPTHDRLLVPPKRQAPCRRSLVGPLQ